MSLLQTQAVSKSFGGIKAVNNCTFEVEKGSITALIGPNGAGKTTVFNLISGLLKPDSGSITYEGTRVDGKKPHQITRRGISRTFQISRDLQEMTLLENLIVQSPAKSFAALFQGSMLKHEMDRAMELLDFMGITHLANEKSRNLSYGQKKLMELAATLMAEPQLILLDEPAGGVNPALLEDILERIQLLNSQGITFLIVEHNMEMVMNLCDPIIVMAYGTVLARGTPQDIQDNKDVLEAYLGQ